MNMRCNIFLKALFFLICSISSLYPDQYSDRVDSLFTSWDKTTTPGISLAIIKEGQIIYQRGYGMAKLEDNIVMTTGKIFDIASASKQFTTACMAILIQEGKIKLNDDIRKYLPEMPNYEKPILIQHLIYHTSGLRDYDTLLGLSGFGPDDCPSVQEAFNIILRQKKLNYLPGERFSYTNTGYFLMSQIIERLSGMPLNAFATKNIFKPLGMNHSFFQENHKQIIPNRASAYTPTETGYQFEMSNWDMTGDGNLYTCVDDLYFWDQAFYNSRLGKDLMHMLQTKGQLNNASKIDYAWGLFIGEYKGLQVVKHGGAWAGYRAEIMRFPQKQFSVICLANLSSQNPTAFCEQIADIYLAPFLKETPKANFPPVIFSKLELEDRAGIYHDPRLGIWLSLFIQEGTVMLQTSTKQIAFTPVSKTLFENIEALVSIEFLSDAKGSVTGAILKAQGQELYQLVKSPPFTPPPTAQLHEYAGKYSSEELFDAIYRIEIEQDTLALKLRHEQFSLKPIAKDQFFQGDTSIDFVRDNGKVVGFKLNTGGRILGLEFVKGL